MGEHPPKQSTERAEAFARETAHIAAVVRRMIDIRQWLTFKHGGILLDSEQRIDLLKFILTRGANWRYGGNLKPSYTETPT